MTALKPDSPTSILNSTQHNAAKVIASALAKGELTRPEHCESCGKHKSEQGNCSINAHHDDYHKPLEVRWLCISCHKRWHVANGPGLNKSFKIPYKRDYRLEGMRKPLL